MRKTLLGLAALAAIATPLAFASSANAATLDAPPAPASSARARSSPPSAGTTPEMQGATATGFTFSTTQARPRPSRRTPRRSSRRTLTADVTRTVSCFIDGKKVDHTAFGTRDGSRTGIRNGERTGTLHGSLKGSLVSTVAYDNKGKTGQWTGFYLTKYAAGSPAFSSTELPVWNTEAVYGDVDYSDAVTTLGDIDVDRLGVGARREPG